MNTRDDDMLEELFAQARTRGAPLPDGLRGKMQIDALSHMPRAPRSFWQVIGGIWGATGLTAATLAGLWIGMVPLPNAAIWADPIAILAGDSPDNDTISLAGWSDFDWAFEEG